METKIIKLEGKYGYQRLLGGAPETAGMRSGSLTLRPGEAVGEHSTGEREEAVIVLGGTAEIMCEGSVLGKIKENTVIYFPPGTKHDIKNAGENDLKYVYVVSSVKQAGVCSDMTNTAIKKTN